MADNTEELNITHDIDNKTSVEIEETKTTNQPVDNTIVITHQFGNMCAEGKVDTTTGIKTGIIDYNINKDTDIEISHNNVGSNFIEVNVKI